LGRLYGDNKQYDQACIALNDALEIEGAHVPRSDERISLTLQAIADTYRASGDLEKAAEYYQKVTVYANLVRRASQDLRDTLNELDRRRATLEAAMQSLALFDRSGDTNVKDLAFIYALIARSHANLNQPRESADTINQLLDVLEARRDDLSPDADDTDHRALAWLVMARLAQDEENIDAARQTCQTALQAVQNVNLRWVIEQVARSMED
jgi:tetratricopeptide (TPR) repeat protein